MRRKATANALEILAEYKVDFRHLDVGCSTYEEDETPFSALCDSYIHIEGDLPKYEFINQLECGFDITLSFDALRFSEDPFAMCAALKYITDDGGYIYVSGCFQGNSDGNWRFTPAGLYSIFDHMDKLSILTSFWETDGKGAAILARKWE